MDLTGILEALRLMTAAGLVVLVAVGCGGGQERERQGSAEQSPASRQLLEQGDSTFRARDYEAAGELYRRAAAEAEAEGHRSNQVEALAQVARSYSIRGLGEEGRPWLVRAASLADEGQPLGWARYQLVRGVYQREDGQREEATATFARLYEYCMGHELHRQAVNAAHMAAIAAETEQQIEWAHRGIRAAEEGGFDDWLAILWNNLGWTYDDLGRYDEALDALSKAHDYHWQTGDEQAKLVADWSVAHALRMVDRLDEARERAAATLAWAERWYAADPGPARAEWVGFAHKEMGELDLAQGRPEDARRELEAALAKLREAGMEKWDAQGFRELADRVAGLPRP
jgi:tetratricopeptide (TPR) repeat protein